MIVFILTLSAFTLGGIFGAFVYKVVREHRALQTQKHILSNTPVHLLQEEVERRVTQDSVYR